MKKVVRLRVQPENAPNSTANRISPQLSDQAPVRTTGRIKKPKAVFDPSDSYLPRSYRTGSATSTSSVGAAAGTSAQTSGAVERAVVAHITGNSGPSNENGDICYVCQKRGTVQKQKTIACISCARKAHKQCLNITFDNMEHVVNNYQCCQCHICEVCNETEDRKALIICVKCCKSYHYQCHIPHLPPTQQIFKNWQCKDCAASSSAAAAPIENRKMSDKTIREIIGDETSGAANSQFRVDHTGKEKSVNHPDQNILPAKRLANGNGNDEHDDELSVHYKKRKLQNCYNESPPILLAGECGDNNDSSFQLVDVKSWNVDQVYEYFVKHFPNEAHVLRDHEIDGASLLLLKRSDIIKKLPLKLGPALRIYNKVLKFQAKMNDHTLGWNCEL